MLDYPDFDRSAQLSDWEFQALPRTPAGDIVELAAWHPYLSDEQRLELSPDDAARCDDFDLEEVSLWADEMFELGISARVAERWDAFEEAA